MTRFQPQILKLWLKFSHVGWFVIQNARNPHQIPWIFPKNIMKKKILFWSWTAREILPRMSTPTREPCKLVHINSSAGSVKMDNLMLFHRGRDFIPTSVTSWRSLGTYLTSILGHNSWKDCVLKVWSSRLLICLWLLGNNAVNYDWLAIYFVSELYTVYHLSFTKAQKLALFPLFHRKANI